MFKRLFRRGVPGEHRVILAHGHIFKNAGSTLDWALKKNLGRRFVDHRDDEPMRTEGAAYLLRYFQENPELKAISSHHLCYPLPDTETISVIPMYLLRDPIERVLSVYEFERKQRGSTPGAINAKKMDIQAYVRWRLQPESGATIRNYQSRYLAGMHRYPRKPVTDENYEQVRANLRGGALVGTVEQLDQTFVEFEAALRTRGVADLDLSYIPQNVNQNRPATPAERMASLQDRLGSDLLGELQEANRYDAELHALISRQMAERLTSERDLRDRVERFQAGCRSL